MAMTPLDSLSFSTVLFLATTKWTTREGVRPEAVATVAPLRDATTVPLECGLPKSREYSPAHSTACTAALPELL
jgi:hypothetical protein